MELPEAIKIVLSNDSAKEVIEIMEAHELDIKDKNLVIAMIDAYKAGVVFARRIVEAVECDLITPNSGVLKFGLMKEEIKT